MWVGVSFFSRYINRLFSHADDFLRGSVDLIKKKKQVISGYSDKNAQLFNQALGNQPGDAGAMGEQLNESAQTKAWMIRRDGKVFEVQIHPYGNPSDYEETLWASEWLYSHTANHETKDLILKFITTWVYDECDFGEATVAEQLDKEIADRPYMFLTSKFVHSISNALEDVDIDEPVEELNVAVNSALNEEFVRARAGGEVNSDASLGEMYFRISSTGFNWFDIIWKFVYDRKSSVDTVTIKRDQEATGEESTYYRHGNKVFDRMPVDEFIMLKGRPVVENLVEDYHNKFLDVWKDGYFYTDEEYREACNALRNDYHSDEDMLLAFFDYPDCSYDYAKYYDDVVEEIVKKYGVSRWASSFDENTAKKIIDEYIEKICPMIDEDFLLDYGWTYFGER